VTLTKINLKLRSEHYLSTINISNKKIRFPTIGLKETDRTENFENDIK
jgi:hypothetical protein